jgi:type III secretion protein J
MKLRFARGLPLLIAAALLAACSQQTLYSKLDEREANEQVARLRDAGIQAHKAARDSAYAVTVPDNDLGRATQILAEQGLPRQAFGSRCSVFKREGFVTTSTQEHQLGLCAVEQQISNALMGLTGVLDARVVLDVPVRNPLMDKVPPPKASVVVKFRQGVDADALKSNVKRVVVHSVDGLSHDNVSVEHSVADARPAVAIQAATGGFAQAMPWPLALTSGAGLAAILGALALWWNGRRNARWTAELTNTAGREAATTTVPPHGLSLRARVAGTLARTAGGNGHAARDAPAGVAAAQPADRDGDARRTGTTG